METKDDRHWNKIKDIVKSDFEVNEELKLVTIWDLKIFEYKELTGGEKAYVLNKLEICTRIILEFKGERPKI